MNSDNQKNVHVIERLSIQDPGIARRVHSLMQAAYKVEAQLLQDDDFPPLRRTVKKLSSSQSRFFGIYNNGVLQAAIELLVMHTEVYIDALVVAPTQFRKGLGTALLQHALGLYPGKTFVVQTGRANFPAVNLYHKSGFATESTTTTPAGLELISLVKEPHKKPDQ